MVFVDSHAHLFFPEYEADFDDVLARAKEAGVRYIVCPGTDLPTSRKSIDLAERYQMIYAAVGFHPHDASKADDASLQEIERLSHHPKVVAIGEIGLDYHYNFSPPDVQREVFARQIAIAAHRQLPIIIHSREAEPDTLSIIQASMTRYPEWRKRTPDEGESLSVPKGVFHCFPGDAVMARKVIDWGFYISIPGPVTFGNKPTKPNSMVDVVSKISPEHILLETDSPFLTPAPNRGKRNEPSYIPHIAHRIAELQNLSVEDIARTSTFGVHKLFGIGDYPSPVIAYTIGNSLYLNLTNRCDADCVFCDRKGEAVVKGYNLKLDREPSIEEVFAALGDPSRYREVVFCGYGEPTIRLDVLKEVARWLKERGVRTRLNTDGHGNLINHRNIVPELVGFIDEVSISLNSTDPEQYGKLMRVDGKRFFDAMVEFARECVRQQIPTTMTVVDVEGIDEEKARQFAEQEIGARFRIRPFF